MNMNLSNEGKNLIKGFESCKLIPYKDSGGVWTWGWGHAKGPHEEIPTSITQEEADALFDYDSSCAIADVNSLFVDPIAQNVFDALCSFFYNVGLTQLRAPPHRTLDAIKSKNWKLAGSHMMNWVHDNGKYVQGLFNRRKKEVDYLLKIKELK